MLELYFERLTRRNSAAYAEACAKYFRDMVSAGPLFSAARPSRELSVQVKFTSIRHPQRTERIYWRSRRNRPLSPSDTPSGNRFTTGQNGPVEAIIKLQRIL